MSAYRNNYNDPRNFAADYSQSQFLADGGRTNYPRQYPPSIGRVPDLTKWPPTSAQRTNGNGNGHDHGGHDPVMTSMSQQERNNHLQRAKTNNRRLVKLGSYITHCPNPACWIDQEEKHFLCTKCYPSRTEEYVFKCNHCGKKLYTVNSRDYSTYRSPTQARRSQSSGSAGSKPDVIQTGKNWLGMDQWS